MIDTVAQVPPARNTGHMTGDDIASNATDSQPPPTPDTDPTKLLMTTPHNITYELSAPMGLIT